MGLLFSGAVYWGASTLLGFLAVVGIGLHCFQGEWKTGEFPSTTDRPGAKTPQRLTDQTLAGWLLAAWFCGLLLATPLYKPYPRLMFPWLMASWLGTSALIGFWFRRTKSTVSKSDQSSVFSRTWFATLVGIASLIVVTISVVASFERISSKGIPGWQDRTALESISQQVIAFSAEAAKSQKRDSAVKVPFIIYVLAEPGLVFHLTSNEIVAYPVRNLESVLPKPNEPVVPTFLLMSLKDAENPQFPQHWERYHSHFKNIATFDYSPSHLVLLNEFHPRQLRQKPQPMTSQLRLLRLNQTGENGPGQ